MVWSSVQRSSGWWFPNYNGFFGVFRIPKPSRIAKLEQFVCQTINFCSCWSTRTEIICLRHFTKIKINLMHEVGFDCSEDPPMFFITYIMQLSRKFCSRPWTVLHLETRQRYIDAVQNVLNHNTVVSVCIKCWWNCNCQRALCSHSGCEGVNGVFASFFE